MNIEQYDSDKFLGGEGLSLPNRSLLKMDRINTQYKGRIEKKKTNINCYNFRFYMKFYRLM